MKFFIALLFFLSTQFCFADKEYLIDLKKDSVLYKNVGFHINKVIDNRNNQANLGYTMKGLFEVNRPIKIKNELDKSLKQYLNSLILNNTFKTIPINLSIKRMSISEEDLGLKQIGTCHIVIEYYDILNNLIYMTDYSESISAFDVTNKYEDLIKYTLKKSLSAFIYYDMESNIYFDLLDKPVLYDSILFCKKPKKGFYANFKEFQANNPSIQFDFTIEEFEDNESQYRRFSLSDSTIDLRNLYQLIYGFSDGETVYIKRYLFNKYITFIPIQILGRYCYVGKRYDSQAVPIIFPSYFGVMGLPYEQDYILNISSNKEHPLTMETLDIILKSDKKLYEIYKNQPYDTRKKMKLYWLEEYNRRYLKRHK